MEGKKYVRHPHHGLFVYQSTFLDCDLPVGLLDPAVNMHISNGQQYDATGDLLYSSQR